jgi:hypothetical protein
MRHPLVAAGLIAVSLVLVGCGSPAADPADEEEKPALVEEVEGAENLHRITLTARAAERLGIETTEVAAVSGRTQVPYSSILYDATGDAWAYVVDGAPLVFVRQAITVDDIVADSRGDYAILGTGPQPGSLVVSVGVAELFGAEFEVGH